MGDIQKIMVAIAFSDYSEGIFTYGARLARNLDADILVVSVINRRDVAAVRKIAALGYEVDGEHYVQGVRDERLKMLEAFVAKAGFPEERVVARILMGDPLDELLKTALLENVDLIVMGVKGRSDLEHILVGSVAEKMFRRSPITIVSYRGEKEAAHLRKRVEHLLPD
jgi:nucleotide-binding universal stress UspA family protein